MKFFQQVKSFHFGDVGKGNRVNGNIINDLGVTGRNVVLINNVKDIVWIAELCL